MGLKFPVHEKDHKKIIFPLVCLVMNIKYHALFVLSNKLLKSMLIYYYYQVVRIPFIF